MLQVLNYTTFNLIKINLLNGVVEVVIIKTLHFIRFTFLKLIVFFI